jgi:O-antigen/teichoic acid export membrane protein
MTLLLYLLFSRKHLFHNYSLKFDCQTANQLIFISLPLLGTLLIDNLLGWVGVLTIGFLYSSDEVALFSAPMRIVTLLQIPLMSFVFLYIPVITRLSKNIKAKFEIQSLYIKTTKWSFIITLPAIIFFLVDAEYIVTLFFGKNYILSVPVLQILSIGYSIHTFLGPNGSSLISLGKNIIVFRGALISGLFIVVLSLYLVPRYGSIGAAIAFTISQVVLNVFYSICLYYFYSIHPFDKNYVKPILLSILFGIIIYFYSKTMIIDFMGYHILIFCIIAAFVLISPILTYSLTLDEIKILRSIEIKIWSNSTITDSLSKFISK